MFKKPLGVIPTPLCTGRFEALIECGFKFVGFVMKVSFSFKSQGSEKIKLSSQGTNSSINLRYESD